MQSEEGFQATIDLEQQVVKTQAGDQYQFDIDAGLKNRLLKGLDDIGLTLEQADAIRAYEERRATQAPWLFGKISA